MSSPPGRVGKLSPLALKQFRTPRLAAWLLLDRVLETVATLAGGRTTMWLCARSTSVLFVP